MKFGNASLDFSHHETVHKAPANKFQDSILGESFAIDDGSSVMRESLKIVSEAFKKSNEDPPIEEAEDIEEAEEESSTPS